MSNTSGDVGSDGGTSTDDSRSDVGASELTGLEAFRAGVTES